MYNEITFEQSNNGSINDSGCYNHNLTRNINTELGLTRQIARYLKIFLVIMSIGVILLLYDHLPTRTQVVLKRLWKRLVLIQELAVAIMKVPLGDSSRPMSNNPRGGPRAVTNWVSIVRLILIACILIWRIILIWHFWPILQGEWHFWTY